jgi:hypothetical protein
MKKILTVIKGGLGNQLFQYSASLALNKKFNNRYILNYHFEGEVWGEKEINLDYLINDVKLDYSSKHKKFSSKIKNLFVRKIFENDSSIKLEDVQNSNFFLLNGYFQNPSWYKCVLKEVCEKIFVNLKKKSKDFDENGLVIAFRRSDYIKLGWEINLNYYITALKYLNKKKNIKVLVVSEDKVFNKIFTKHLKYLGYIVKEPDIRVKNYPKSFIDLISIIKSKNLIISNSSFNWWGAAIREFYGYENSKVIFPKNWYPKNLNYKHPGFLEGWSEMDNSFN